MMRSARLRLPSHISRPTSRVMLRLLYLGSGNTTRCGTVPRRGIRSICLSTTLPTSGHYFFTVSMYKNEQDARQREGYRSIHSGTPLVGSLSDVPKSAGESGTLAGVSALD